MKKTRVNEDVLCQRTLLKFLSKDCFKKNPSRLFALAFCVLANIGLIALVLNTDLAWPVKILIGLAMGQLNGGMAFFAHEALHGSVVKNKKWQDIFSFIAWIPFQMSPTAWRHWHNCMHHGNTQSLLQDPDAFPTLMAYRNSAYMRFIYPLLPGSKTFFSYFYFTYWLSFQTHLNQLYMRFKNKAWVDADHKRITQEYIVQLCITAVYFYIIGWSEVLYLAMIPFLTQNYLLMSYISTNHNLSPLTKNNDTLVSSLSVRNHPVLEFLHFNFGYHVEHHLFPSVSPKHAQKIHQVLLDLYPDKFLCMPKAEALRRLYATPRIYKTFELLVDPRNPKFTAATLKANGFSLAPEELRETPIAPLASPSLSP